MESRYWNLWETSKEKAEKRAAVDFFRHLSSSPQTEQPKEAKPERLGTSQRDSASWGISDLLPCVSNTLQSVPETFRSVLDTFLPEQERRVKEEIKQEIKQKIKEAKKIEDLDGINIESSKKELKGRIIDDARKFINEYKNMKNVYQKLFHAIHIGHTSERLLNEGSTSREQLEQMQEQIDQSLEEIGKLREDKGFPQENFGKIADDTMPILANTTAFVRAVDEQIGIGPYYKALGDYMGIYSEEAEVFAKVLKDEKNQSLEQLQRKLEESSKQICQRLVEAARKDFEEAQHYCESHKEALNEIRAFNIIKHINRYFVNIKQKMSEAQSALQNPETTSQELLQRSRALADLKSKFSCQLEELEKYLDARSEFKSAITAIDSNLNNAEQYWSKYKEAKLNENIFENDYWENIKVLSQNAKKIEKQETSLEQLLEMSERLKNKNADLSEKLKTIKDYLYKAACSTLEEFASNFVDYYNKVREHFDKYQFKERGIKKDFPQEFDLFIEPDSRFLRLTAYDSWELREVYNQVTNQGVYDPNAVEKLKADREQTIATLKLRADIMKIPQVMERFTKSWDLYLQRSETQKEEKGETQATGQWNFPPRLTQATGQPSFLADLDSGNPTDERKVIKKSEEIDKELTDSGFKKVRWARTQCELWDDAWKKTMSGETEPEKIMSLAKALWYQGEFRQKEEDTIKGMKKLSEEQGKKILAIFSECLKTLDSLLSNSNPYRDSLNDYFSKHYGLDEAQALYFRESGHDTDKGHFFSRKECNAIINWYDDNYIKEHYTKNVYESAFTKLTTKGYDYWFYQLKRSDGKSVQMVQREIREKVWQKVTPSQISLSAQEDIPEKISPEELSKKLEKLLDGNIPEDKYPGLFKLKREVEDYINKKSGNTSEITPTYRIPGYIPEYIPKDEELLEARTLANALWNGGELTQRQKQRIKANKSLSEGIRKETLDIFSECLKRLNKQLKSDRGLSFDLLDKEDRKALVDSFGGYLEQIDKDAGSDDETDIVKQLRLWVKNLWRRLFTL